MSSPRRLVSYESDPETRTICSSGYDKMKENGDKMDDQYSDDHNERLDIDDESHGPPSIPRKSVGLSSVDKLEGKSKVGKVALKGIFSFYYPNYHQWQSWS